MYFLSAMEFLCRTTEYMTNRIQRISQRTDLNRFAIKLITKPMDNINIF